ncbi:hypothetical protein AALO_G00106580 [Alosa alosa]|uniref:Uncharacterized protein n=1 Tax=Alosa alosa TaxID=278164 RepID=A0AAV6GQ05_9TELE|nr:leucine-rich repeat-containing protein 15 [Alosa sapidissima]XP_041950212.1 leucine-rich repeat-containing protein 15 [Alosa sapidissima]XP_048106647.1 leucine-rich repeat-containing protein 15 [Alosa alosa]KAG5276519.1 hypothetical protein AALO_G00106580 [Alosa alosa]
MRLITCLPILVLWGINSAESCPDNCRCTQKKSPERSEVNCQKRGFSTFPSNLPMDTWVLKMGENRLEDIRPNILSVTPNIESVNLERNVIKSIHPQAFTGGKKLMLLNLYGNQISKLPSKGFKDLLSLRFLLLGQNQIATIKSDMFTGMRNLSDLDLPLNSLTALPPSGFKPLIALKVLDLALNKIQKISRKAFVGLQELLFLNLDNNNLKNIPIGTFKPLTGLEMLVLDHNHLTTLTSSTFEGLYNLQELYLRNNEIDKLPADVFRHTPKLMQVALSRNKMQTIDGNMLANLQGLKEVYLHDNPWMCDCNINSLVHWITQAKVNQSPLEKLHCVGPEEFREKPLHSLTSQSLHCTV